MSRSSGSARLAAVALALLPVTASATPLWTSAEGDRQLEVRGFYKVFGLGLAMPAGLVEGTAALDAAFAEAGLSERIGLPRAGAMTAHTGRLESRLVWGDWLELTAAWQVEAVLANDAAFASGASLTGTLTEGGGPQRRLADFGALLYGSPGLRLQHNLDRLAARISAPFGDLVIGRQVLSWGTGRLWNPTDLLSPFGPNEIDREVRRGIDAVRLSLPLARAAPLELVWLPRWEGQENGGALRVQANAHGFDFSLSAAKYVDDVLFGADFAGDAGPLGIHGEASYTLGLRGVAAPGPIDVGERAFRAVVGTDLRLGEKAAFTVEYHFNGWGAASPSGYLAALTNERSARGEVFGAGRHYLGVVASYQLSELLTAQAIALVNLTDPSVQLTPVVEYWFEQSVILRAGAFVPIGVPPDPTELRALTGADVLSRSGPFLQATSSLGMKSEYGASPAGVFAQVGVYFQ
jgi:hypothetical protein